MQHPRPFLLSLGFRDNLYDRSRCKLRNTSLFASIPTSCASSRHNTVVKMSVPEYVRRRNSTMFVGRPPFGSLGCESGDRTIPSGWTPPMSPPPGMAYSEGPYSAYPRQCQREVQRQNSPEPSTMSPDLTWRSESAAALFSSPRIPPATVVSGGISPMVKSTDDDNKDSTRNCDTTKAISPKDAVKGERLSNLHGRPTDT